MSGRQCGRERLEHAQFGQQGAAIVHVYFVLAGPMKGFAGKYLEAGELDSVPLVKLDVRLGKIFSHDADQLYRTEKTGGNGRMAGGAAKQAGIFSGRGFDRIQRSGTNNKDTHSVER